MFWNKKEDKTGLPDLPPIKSPFSKELLPVQENVAEPENVVDNNPLPTFPDSPSDKGFSQSAIKEAVSDNKEPNPFIAENNDNVHMEEDNFKSQEIKEDYVEEPKEESYETSIRSLQPKAPDVSSIPKYEEKTTSESNYLEPSLNLPIGLPPQEETPMPKKLEKMVERPQERIVSQILDRPLVEKTIQYEKPQAPAPKNADIYVKIDKFMAAKKSLISIKEQVGQIDDLLRKIRETKLREERELSVWEKEIFSIKEKIKDVNDSIFDKAQ